MGQGRAAENTALKYPTGPLPLLWLPALHCKALNTEDKYILERFANGEGVETLQVKIELLLMGWRFILC